MPIVAPVALALTLAVLSALLSLLVLRRYAHGHTPRGTECATGARRATVARGSRQSLRPHVAGWRCARFDRVVVVHTHRYMRAVDRSTYTTTPVPGPNTSAWDGGHWAHAVRLARGGRAARDAARRRHVRL